jgi:hypothetical protein
MRRATKSVLVVGGGFVVIFSFVLSAASASVSESVHALSLLRGRSSSQIVRVSDTPVPKIAEITPMQLQEFGLSPSEVKENRDKFPHRCDIARDEYRDFLFSDDLLRHYERRGFSKDAICLALHSALRFDPETGKQLPIVSVRVGQSANDFARELPLLIPDCFKNGTPMLDCTIRFDWYEGGGPHSAKEVNEYKAIGRKVDSSAKNILRRSSKPVVSGTAFGAGSLVQAIYRSSKLPRGYGYWLAGPEGDDPDVQNVDLETLRKDRNVAAPWK